MKTIVTLLLALLISTSCFAKASGDKEAFFVAQKAFEDGFYEVSQALLERFLANYPVSPLRRDASFCLGQCYFYRRLYTDSLKVFKELLESRGSIPIYDKLFYWLGEVYFKINDFQKASKYYGELIALYPNSTYTPAGFYSLGWCLFEQGKFNEAKEKFLEFKSIFPQDQLAEEAAFKAAECLYNNKDYSELKSYLEGFRKDYPDSSKAGILNFYLAESCFYMQDYASAAQSYQEALKFSPGPNLKNLIFLGLGWSYLKSNNYSLANNSFDSVSDGIKDKNSVESLVLGEALCFQMLDNLPKARENYERLRLFSKSPKILLEASLGEAEALDGLGDHGASVSSYNRALEYIKEDTPLAVCERLHYGLGLAYLNSLKLDEAEKEFRLLLGAAKDLSVKISALKGLADAHIQRKEFDKAISILRGVLSDYPSGEDNGLIQYDLALALFQANQYKDAIEEFKKINNVYPHVSLSAGANFYIAGSYFQLGDFLNSYIEVGEFLNKYPDDSLTPKAYILQGLSLKAMKRFEDANNIFKKVLKEYNQDLQAAARAEFEYADCLYQLGRKASALENFELLRSKYPQPEISNLVSYRLAEHNFNEGNFSVSIRYLLDIINNKPQDSMCQDSLFLLGLCYEKQKDYPAALEMLSKIKGRNDEVYLKIARVFKASGDPNNAVHYYRLAMDEPLVDKGECRFSLAECFEEQGNLDAALKEYAGIIASSEGKKAKSKDFFIKGLLRSARILEMKEDWQLAIGSYEKVASLSVEESKFAKERIEQIRQEYLVSKK